MTRARLRIYYGPPAEPVGNDSDNLSDGRRLVTVPLGDILAALTGAMVEQRAWLRDFGDDPITVSSDLYEAILAYQSYRRTSA
ncbi:MAG: hypothetical protein FJ297_11620 [Planctomycetes bacterium]|nr:hypothetical protein [Planctomycetota bacterium]